jgi:DNA-binding transcriptional ArsR family regulator
VSNVNLDTPEDVISFLRILAEESVGDARQALYDRSLKSDEKTYGKLDEVDPPEEEIEVDVEEEEDFTVDEEPPPVDLEVSMDSISAAVNQLRSGRSVDDSEMKTQLRTYFDRLDGTEREALLVFLTAFSGILTRSVTGNDAPDPSEPPSSITMKHGEEAPEAEPEAALPPPEEEVEEEESEEIEDTTPPIKAGGQQSLQEIRRRVRELMRAH